REDIQFTEEDHSLRGRRGGVDGVAAVRCADRRVDIHRLRGKIIFGNQAAILFHPSGDLFRQFTLIERRTTLAPQKTNRVREIFIPENLPRTRHVLPTFEERFCPYTRLIFQGIRDVRDDVRAVRRQREAVPCVLLGGAQEIAHAQTSPPLGGG